MGHEDVGYSYVVIRRGSRPPFDSDSRTVGRMGPISFEEAQQDARRSALVLYPDTDANEKRIRAQEEGIQATDVTVEQQDSPEDIEGSLREYAYHWPRLVFPPLKRSGHIILDSCTPGGMTFRKPMSPMHLPFSLRQNHAPDYPQVAGKTGVLRCKEVCLG